MVDKLPPEPTSTPAVPTPKEGPSRERIAQIKAVLARTPDDLRALKGLAAALFSDNSFADAVTICERVAELEPNNRANLLNCGLALFAAERYAEASNCLVQGLSEGKHSPGHMLLLAKSLIKIGDSANAAAAIQRLRAASPDLPETDFLDFELRQSTCAWGEDYFALLERMRRTAEKSACRIEPGSVLSAPGFSGALHRKIADAWAENVQVSTVERSFEIPPGKIRVGYISPDLQRNHPVGRLIQAVAASHDRSAFDVYGFSLRARREKYAEGYRAFDFIRFLDGAGDEEAVSKIRAEGIEILVDLAGYFSGCRPRIFAHRAAPIQINYMGFPGTLGGHAADYLIADTIAIPLTAAADFSEALAYMPAPCLNGGWDRPAPAQISRRDLQVEDDTLVLCCPCTNHKITPDIFDVWLGLLDSLQDSVLWLRDNGPIATSNLRRRAKYAGVAPERLTFMPNLSREEYFARLGSADLFLDTFPYTAGSSAADALWAGLPILTQAGNSYVSRLAASTLHAAGLGDLIALSRDDYVGKAFSLARDRGRLLEYRRRLCETRPHNPVFDARLCARNLEVLFQEMSRRRRAGAPPSQISRFIEQEGRGT